MRKFPISQFKEFPKELAVLKRLKDPGAIQDLLNELRIDFDTKGNTYYSPLTVIQKRKAHCMEGALLAAAAFWYHGIPPLILDLKTADDDEDHVVALFKQGGRWGAVSKTNHAVLRYRDPVYKDIRELVMSYFNEYFLDNGKKTLRSYAGPFDLLSFGNDWLTATDGLQNIGDALDRSPHVKILKKGVERHLRPAENIEIEAGKILEWKSKNKK
jgi:hypothetical protein